MNSLTKKMIWLTLFSIAMGYMESVIVVYLRMLFYPKGFVFPLLPIDTHIAVIEFWREAATIIMLLGIGILVGKTKIQRLAYFVFSFAIWDIFYYVFLKVMLGWPESLFTWDILFLIPVPWVGPVIAPCLVSLTMIVLTLVVVYFEEKGAFVEQKWKEWLLLIGGSLVVILSFVWDYIVFINRSNAVFWTLSDHRPMFEEISQYVPHEFNWTVFCAGELLIVLAIVRLYKRYLSSLKQAKYE